MVNRCLLLVSTQFMLCGYGVKIFFPNQSALIKKEIKHNGQASLRGIVKHFWKYAFHEDRYNSHICTVNIKPEPAAG